MDAVAKIGPVPEQEIIMTIDTKQPIGEALSGMNWEYIQNRIESRFDCEVALDNVESVFTKARDVANKLKTPLGQGWPDSTWIMWLKNRIQFSHGSESDTDSAKLNPLHVFFISIPEDITMIGRLEDDAWFPLESTSRSRLSSTQMQSIQPINRTAWLVAPKE